MDGDQGKEHENNKPGDAGEHPPTRECNPPSILTRASEQQQREAISRPDYDRRHYWVQVATVSIGVIVAAIYGCQLGEMRKATRATLIAAQAAEASIKQAEVSNRLDQRAWVFATGIEGSPKIGSPFVITVFVRNTGKTVASAVWTSCIAEIIRGKEQPHFNHEARKEEGDSVSLLAPGGQFVTVDTDIDSWNNTTQEHIDLINSGNIVIYVHGTISYGDIFDCWHWTTFCFRLRRDGQYENCETHNAMDNGRCP